MADENQFPKFLRNTDFYLTATSPPLVQVEVIFGYLDNLLEFEDLGVSFGFDNLHSFPQWQLCLASAAFYKASMSLLEPLTLASTIPIPRCQNLLPAGDAAWSLGPYSC